MFGSIPRAGFAAGFASILSVLAGGCAFQPPDAAIEPVNALTAYASAESLKAATGASWPDDAWWRAYGDPQLTALIEEGCAGASDMRIAAARADLAAAAVGPARGALLPRVSAAASVDSEKQTYNYLISSAVVPKGWNDAGVGSLNLNWEIDFWGKNRALLAAAKGEAEAAKVEAAAARLALSTGIASTYARLAALYADRDAAESDIRVRKETLDLMSDRFARSLENEGALERARSAESMAEAERDGIDENIALTRNLIAAMIGAGPDRGLAITRPMVIGGRFAGVPRELPVELVGRRPDIVAARLTAEAAAQRIDAAKAAFYPNVNIAAVIGRQALGVNVLTQSGSTFGSVGPAVSLPIFDGGQLVAGKKGAEATYDIAVATYDKTLTEALHQVADAVVSKRQLVRRLGDAQRSAAAAEKAWRVMSDRYNGGLSTYLEVLGAEDALIAARRTTAALRARAFELDIAMVRALGGGFHSQEKQS